MQQLFAGEARLATCCLGWTFEGKSKRAESCKPC